MDVSIRFAVTQERALLEGIQREASLQSPRYRNALLEHPDAVGVLPEQVAERRIRVASVRGAVVGFAVLLPPVAGVAELDGVFVKPAFWRNGIGRSLIADVVTLAVAEGARALDATVNPEALAFYVHCGFASTGNTPTRFGSALRMRRVTGREAGTF